MRLVNKVETLLQEDVSKEEVLRQLRRHKPDLKKGDVLRWAEILLNKNNTQHERAEAHEYLKDFMSLENSYCAADGPFGRFSKTVTIWDHPGKPAQMIGLLPLLFCAALGVIVYALGAPGAFVAILLGLGGGATYITSMELAVANNKWEARVELNEKIIRKAQLFEALLEKVLS